MAGRSATKNKEITIKDVAKRSGVSATTVSRVLSNSDYPVSAKVRDRVLEVARDLRYQPSPVRSKRGSNEISVLVPTVANPFYTTLITGFENVMVKEGYRPLIYTTNAGLAGENEGQILQSVLQRGGKGLLIAAANMYPVVAQREEELATRNVRVVLADCASPDNRYNNVYYDYEKGSYIGTEYLIAHGHSRIVYAGLELERESRVLRVQGFRRAMLSHGLPCDDSSIILYTGTGITDNTQIESGEELARRVLALPRMPTAVAAINDMVAFGMLRYFHRNRVRVPEDISLIGFDDGIFCDMSHPSLTTVKVQSEQMGRMAAMLLLDDMRGTGGAAVGLSLEPCVVRRESVKRLSQ